MDCCIYKMNIPTKSSLRRKLSQEMLNLSRTSIIQWTRKHTRSLSKSTRTYIRKKLQETKKDPFGYFYLLYKLHKIHVQTRPVCSDFSSIPHALGQWVDEMLQPIVQAKEVYFFKDSFALKNLLDALNLVGNHSLVTCDSVSLYTTIGTDQCITQLSTYLLDPATSKHLRHYPQTKASATALKLVMNNN
jgi:hypothetical protein